MKLNNDILKNANKTKYPLAFFTNFFTVSPEVALELSFLSSLKKWRNTDVGVSGDFRHTEEIINPSKTLQEIYTKISDKKMSQFVSILTGRTMEFTGYTIQVYDRQGYLAAHSDMHHGSTLVFYFAPDWKPSWGGLLEFSYNNGPWGAVGIPRLGGVSFCESNLNWRHRVSRVSLKARFPRIGIVARFNDLTKKEESA